MRNIKIKQKR